MLSVRLTAALLYIFISFPGYAATPQTGPEADWRQISRILAGKGLSANWRDEHGHSVMYFHLHYGSERKVLELLRKIPRRQIVMEGHGRLMHLAVLHGSQSVVAELLRRGESPNATTSERPPLALAVAAGHLEIIRMLVKAGARIGPTAETDDLFTSAFRHGNGLAANLLVDLGAPLARHIGKPSEAPVVREAINGADERSLMLLAELGFNLHVRHEDGESNCFYAARQGQQAEAAFSSTLRMYRLPDCPASPSK